MRRIRLVRSPAMPLRPSCSRYWPLRSRPLATLEAALPSTPRCGALSRSVSPSDRMPLPIAWVQSSAFWPMVEAACLAVSATLAAVWRAVSATFAAMS